MSEGTVAIKDLRRNEFSYPWHRAINEFMSQVNDNERIKLFDESRFMYDAKHLAEEAVRLTYWFKKEREGTMSKVFRKCSCCTEGKHIEDNHLTCCLGVECRKCPQLLALDKAEMPPEAIDQAKAWTCCAHILSKGGGDMAGEGFILTTDDRMYWDSVYDSLASASRDLSCTSGSQY